LLLLTGKQLHGRIRDFGMGTLASAAVKIEIRARGKISATLFKG
jgi:hypothetical protein